MSVNKVILLGHAGKDPEVRYLDNGTAVASIAMATTERGYTLQNGTVIPDRTEWHQIIAWKGLGEIAEKYIRKGSQIYVEGKLTTRSWEKDGITRYKTEIVAEKIELLGKKPESKQQTEQPAQPAAEPSRAAQQPGFEFADGSDGQDDLPF